MAKDRLTWDEYFMNLAITVSQRGTCDRAYVGCVIVNNDHRIVTTGYNGSITVSYTHLTLPTIYSV